MASLRAKYKGRADIAPSKDSPVMSEPPSRSSRRRSIIVRRLRTSSINDGHHKKCDVMVAAVVMLRVLTHQKGIGKNRRRAPPAREVSQYQRTLLPNLAGLVLQWPVQPPLDSCLLIEHHKG